MSEEEKRKKGGVSRREFLRDAGFAVGGVAVSSTVLGACAPKEVIKEVPGKEVIKEVPGPTKTAEVVKEVPEKLTKLIVNGETYEMKIEPHWMLSYVLRDKLGLTGTKIGCDMGTCGHCTVLIDGRPELSCLKLAIEVEGKRVITIEGLTKYGEKLTPIQQAFWDYGAIQCGRCMPGQIISAHALLLKNPNPNEADVRRALSGTYCACAGYQKSVEATLAAAKIMRGG